MKNVISVGILAASSFVIGCRSAPPLQSASHESASPQSASTQPTSPQSGAPLSASPQSAPSQSVIDIVRNGYLKYNQTTTIGKALAGTFQNAEWKSFTTEKGATIVEFDGAAPFSEFRSTLALTAGHMGAGECSENPLCAALDKKLSDYCDSAAGQDQATKDYLKESDRLWAKVLDARKQQSALSTSGVNDANKAHDLNEEQSQLQAQAMSLHKPENSCFDNTYKQHANDPIPVVVQFSINHDGTFQYGANDMGLSVEDLFEKIYN